MSRSGGGRSRYTRKRRGPACLLWSALALVGAAWSGEPPAGDERLQGYRYLDELRARAGLPALARDAALERAASAHARYMSQQRLLSHRQRRGEAGYTGVTAGQRAIAAGYAHTEVFENVARRHGGAVASIDGLMAAIYHRFGFLDLTISEVGMGLARRAADQPAYTAFLMGDGAVTGLCGEAGYAGGGEYTDDLCGDRRRVSRAALVAVREQVLRSRPELVIWPGRGDRDVPPVFYDEIPDPLPDTAVSGYPVSVQFNPLYCADVQLERFVLRDGRGGQALPAAALIDRASDPHGLFTAHQFALFPRDRLEWGHPYAVELVYRLRGRQEVLEWSFSTRAAPAPLIRLGASGARYALASGEQVALYWAPTAERPTLRDPRWTFPRTLEVAFEWYDRNTVLITMRGKPGERAHLAFAGGYGFDLVVAAPARTQPSPPAPRAGEGSHAPRADAPAGASIVSGEGERFRLRSGGTYRFTVRPAPGQPQLGKVRYRYTRGMVIKVTRIGANDLELHVAGRPGDEAIFELGGQRSFSVVVRP